MSDTPRTDKACWVETNQANELVMARFARELERELAAVTAERDKLLADKARLLETLDTLASVVRLNPRESSGVIQEALQEAYDLAAAAIDAAKGGRS